MNPLRHPNTNAVLGKPANWKPEDGECLELPIVRDESGSLTCLNSYWRPTPVELKALNEGGAVNLRIFARAHPVVWLGTIDRAAQYVDQDKPLIVT
jgi:hypothetical protein